jgi:hypothetical protein
MRRKRGDGLVGVAWEFNAARRQRLLSSGVLG